MPGEKEMMERTKGVWKFERMQGFDDLHKLKGTLPEPHEGYFRHNDGSFVVTTEYGGPVAAVTFKGKAKRGQAWNAPDAEGMANARLIAAAPDLLDALKALMPEGWGDDDTMDHMPGIKLARAAIAKATRTS